MSYSDLRELLYVRISRVEDHIMTSKLFLCARRVVFVKMRIMTVLNLCKLIVRFTACPDELQARISSFLVIR